MAVNDQVDNAKKKKWFPTSRREEIIERQYLEIKKLESRYRHLYEGSPVMLRTINTEGIILDCNRAYVTKLGHTSKNEIVGHSIFEHVPADSTQALKKSFEEWRRNGIVSNMELRFKRKAGDSFPVLISANNLYDNDGKLVGSNTVIIDMTETLRAKEQLEKANKELNRANEMKEEFVRIAAHELRTPIQPILLTAETAAESDDWAYQKEAWKIVTRQAKRLLQLANDILDVSRIESGNLSYDMKMTSAKEIMNEIIDYSKIGIEGHRGKPVAIESQIVDDVELFLDRNRIIQALTNVMNNSLKFTEQGQITIEAKTLANEQLYEIKIIDTGTGISKEILPNLFGKFVTKNSDRDSKKHGTGLGLFITKRIIQAHGGDIVAYNNSDNGKSAKGATFIIRLPIPK